MAKEKTILTTKDLNSTITQLAKDIVKNQTDTKSIVLIGIHTRGVPLAKRLQKELKTLIKQDIPLGTLDITLYRDDLATVGPAPIVKGTDITFDITDKVLILVDDVLFTGRTARSALNELSDFGRTRRIQLAVLIDRGYRELPIAADYIGKTVKTKQSEIIEVRFTETDNKDEVIIK